MLSLTELKAIVNDAYYDHLGFSNPYVILLEKLNALDTFDQDNEQATAAFVASFRKEFQTILKTQYQKMDDWSSRAKGQEYRDLYSE